MALSVLFKMAHLEMSLENMEHLAFILECFILLFTINKNITQISILLLLLFLSNNIRDFPGDSAVRNSPANMQEMQKTWVGSLGWKIPWRRKWQPTPVFLPGQFHGQRSPVGHSPWGPKESDMTEQLSTHKKLDTRNFLSHSFLKIIYLFAALGLGCII